MRGRILAVALYLGTATLSGCSGVGDREVLAIEETKTYHRNTCPPVRMAKTTPMTVSQADALHYTPCPVCKPNLR